MEPAVYLVDDDAGVRDAVTFLLEAEGIRVVSAASPDELLGKVTPENRGCLLLDVRLPGMNGLELQQVLRERRVRMPVIFISGHGDIPMAVRAVNEGALDFLEKPFKDAQLLEKIRNAMTLDAVEQEEIARRGEVEERLQTLTPREREVLEGILEGKLSKVIAWEMEVSVRTVEVHRAHVIEKLGARNTSELVRLVLSTSTYRNWLL